MATDRLITLAIHTYDYARRLSELLERNNIPVTLQNVNLENPTLSPGIRVRINESHLPMALRIIENQDLFQPNEPTIEVTPNEILVPVDFSEYSLKACRTAIELASYHKASITLLHTYINPIYAIRAQLSDVLSFDENLEEANNQIAIRSEAERQMNELSESLRNQMKQGLIPLVKFTTLVSEGVPEDVINQYAKEHHPMLIIMGTRGADTKDREMVGSVTAEVLDTCRQPMFTIPGNISPMERKSEYNALFFSNFDQDDILAIDTLFQLLPFKNINMKLVKLPSKKSVVDPDSALEKLRKYCMDHYPHHTFTSDSVAMTNVEGDFNRIAETYHIDLIAIPSKKKSVFARLFNPGIAHRLLFHADIPMVVIPV